MSEWSYDPSTLPDVAAVDVVVVAGAKGSTGGERAIALNVPSVRLEGEAAEALARLWRDLPPGSSRRCHIPTYGLRFFDCESTQICAASLCWECHNIYGLVDDLEFAFAFDADHEVSRHLLDEVKAIAAHLTDPA